MLAKLYAEHSEIFPKEKLEWAVKMVQEKDAKVESTAIRQMREEVGKIWIDKKDWEQKTEWKEKHYICRTDYYKINLWNICM